MPASVGAAPYGQGRGRISRRPRGKARRAHLVDLARFAVEDEPLAVTSNETRQHEYERRINRTLYLLLTGLAACRVKPGIDGTGETAAIAVNSAEMIVPRVGIEPTTRGFSVRCSTN